LSEEKKMNLIRNSSAASITAKNNMLPHSPSTSTSKISTEEGPRNRWMSRQYIYY
jgi:hypothetical protein